jgi:FemAB-related protein (PEP-CTERM system-associated)
MTAHASTTASVVAAPSVVVVSPLTAAEEAAWDSYVAQQDAAEFFSLLGWRRIIEDAYGYRPHYMIATRDGAIVGILPLFLVSNFVTGKKLISVPFGVYGGVLADDNEVEKSLHVAAQDLGRKLNVDYVELRYRTRPAIHGWVPIEQYVTFTTTLEQNEEAMMKKLPRDTRYMIRKGQKAGLVAKEGLEQMDVFVDMFARNMQNHGTPMFPARYFGSIAKHLADHSQILVLWNDKVPVAGVLSFIFKDSILPYYAGVTDEARRNGANNLLYWELMARSIARGFRNFDFGRSKKGTGAFDFKNGWGMTITQLDYQMFLVRRKEAPNFSPTNPKFAQAASVWRKLPLGFTKFIGPLVSPWFP